MTEASVKSQIDHLIALQKLDLEIYEIANDLEEKPAIIEDLKQKFESSQSHLKELEDQAKQIQVERKEFELDLKSKEDATAKAKTVLNELKTNKEYSAKISEIESIKADQSQIEEKILLSYDESERVDAAIAEEKVRVAEREKEFNEQKKTIEAEMAAMKARTSTLEQQKQEIIPNCDPKFFTQYGQILKSRNGLAIVPVVNGICGGCYMNVTQQTLNLLKKSEELITCEMCTRILYLERD